MIRKNGNTKKLLNENEEKDLEYYKELSNTYLALFKGASRTSKVLRRDLNNFKRLFAAAIKQNGGKLEITDESLASIDDSKDIIVRWYNIKDRVTLFTIYK